MARKASELTQLQEISAQTDRVIDAQKALVEHAEMQTAILTEIVAILRALRQ